MVLVTFAAAAIILDCINGTNNGCETFLDDKKISCNSADIGNLTIKSDLVNNTDITELSVFSSKSLILHYDVFHKMVNLNYLTLCDNKIKYLDSRLFSYLHKLIRLNLEYNNIETLESNIFSNLTNLTHLYMAHNHLKSLTDVKLFQSQTRLIILTLNDNNMRTISAGVLSPLISLKKFKLADNPFSCTCQVQEIILWPESKCINTRATCEEPRKFENEHFPFNETKIIKLNLNNNSIQSLKSNAFDKLPEITILQLSLNKLITLKQKLFYGLKDLIRISLDSNLLESLDDRLFRYQAKLITLHLHDNKLLTITEKLLDPLIILQDLTLKDNPLNCDCKLQSALNLVSKNKILSDAVCETPEKYAGKSWELMEKELECGSTITTQTVIIVSSGITLFCYSSVVVCYVCIRCRKTCRKRTNRHTNENVQYDDVETMANTSPKTASFSNTENLYDYPIFRNSYLSIIDSNVKSEPVIYDDVV
ncbi:hypothetical protein L9F63_014977 [Diploptera punctata]|uniref:LRRCT domain-containing protein n=1 Tax=Diploptera punctata TaxID=6984 RepID=A0AAD8EKD5_DIPPU|nr:hypothetical protein L9F63_014977 [Diploptera punctata]